MPETAKAHDPHAGVTIVRRRKAKIILLSTVAAIAYGVVHDQITARLCVEYFTMGHPPLWWARGKPRVISILPNTTGEVIRAMILAAIAALVLWFRFAQS